MASALTPSVWDGMVSQVPFRSPLISSPLLDRWWAKTQNTVKINRKIKQRRRKKGQRATRPITNWCHMVTPIQCSCCCSFSIFLFEWNACRCRILQNKPLNLFSYYSVGLGFRLEPLSILSKKRKQTHMSQWVGGWMIIMITTSPTAAEKTNCN